MIHNFIHRLKLTAKSILSGKKYSLNNLPLTHRAIFFLCGALYLLLIPVQGENDLVSAAVAYSLLGALLLITCSVIGWGILLRTTVQPRIFFADTPLLSGEGVGIPFELGIFRLLPFTYLSVSFHISPAEPSISVIRLSGSSKELRTGKIVVNFPHRGEWRVEQLELRFLDVTGLARLRWLVPIHQNLSVYPPKRIDTHFPVLSSAQRPGDLVVDLLNRNGDLYDIKPYHPTDGVKKIIWKAFAKRGELLSRHPEASMTPEGLVVVFALARTIDDSIAALSIAYVSMLKELGLDVIFGCEGQGLRPCATNCEDAEKLLVSSAWEASPQDSPEDTQTQRDLGTVLTFCRSKHPATQIDKVVLFCSEDRLSYSREASSIRRFAEMQSQLGVKPAFCILKSQTDLDNSSGRKNLIATTSERLMELIRQNDSIGPNKASHSNSYRGFVAACMARDWEVYS